MPRCFGAVGIGAHEQIDPVRELRARRPDLLAVDDEVVAVVHGAGRSAARSEPASGSEKPWHQMSSAERMRGRKRCFCSSVPRSISAGPIMPMPE